MQVDALGRRKRPPLRTRQPVQGKQLKLSLDFDLQRRRRSRRSRPSAAAQPGAFVAMDPRNGEVLALGLAPRPSTPTSSPSRVTESTLQDAALHGQRRAAARPRDRRRCIRPARRSSRSPRWRRSQSGAITPASRRSTTPASSRSAHRRSTTPAAPPTAPLALRQALKVSSDVFFYTLGARLNGDSGDAAPAAGRTSSASAADRHRPPRRVHGPPAHAGSGATACSRRTRPTARGRSATTSTSRSARATCRPRRCRWPSPTRRSPTAAACRARTSACEIEDAAGRVLQEIDPGAGAAREDRPAEPPGDPRRPARAPRRAGRHLGRRLRAASRTRSTARPAPPSARARPTSPGTSATCPTPSARSWSW